MSETDSEAEAAHSEAGDGRLPPSGIALVILLGFIWGINWPAIRTAVTEISPWTFRVICLAVGAATLFVTLFIRGTALRVPRAEIMPLVVLALLNVTGYQLLTAFGLSEMEAGRGVILAFTFPLWSVLFGTVVLREKLTGTRLVALCLGLAAMALLLGPEITRLGHTPMVAVFLICAALSWAAATVMRRDMLAPVKSIRAFCR